MNTNELRLGNWIWSSHGQYDRIESKVTAIHLGYVNTSYDNSDSDLELRYIEPIPLTEEWLLKFGFESALNGWFCSREYLWLRQHKLNNEWWAGVNGIGDIDCTRIDYTHQLQNLYFALTGEELTIKEQ